MKLDSTRSVCSTRLQHFSAVGGKTSSGRLSIYSTLDSELLHRSSKHRSLTEGEPRRPLTSCAAASEESTNLSNYSNSEMRGNEHNKIYNPDLYTGERVSIKYSQNYRPFVANRSRSKENGVPNACNKQQTVLVYERKKVVTNIANGANDSYRNEGDKDVETVSIIW
ncbi:hypothetical protein FHG87_001736 [Trinorchestia longiramus]|nr:hypothetical protein FHG87_001736 [Trinorchestia longiramus]